MEKYTIVALLVAIVAIIQVNSSPALREVEESRASDRVFVCYYGSWAKYRPGNGKFDVENIDPYLCTHLIYGFAGLKENKIAALDPYNDLVEDWGLGAFKRFVNLKRYNPNLKILIAIGGWNEGSQKYSQMASNPGARAVFVQSTLEFLEKHKFDGLDMDWEYPANREGAQPEDKENFIQLLIELKAAFKPHGYLLTAAVSAGKGTIDTAYDVPRVAEQLDLINIMSYDFHGAWHQYVHHNAPLDIHPMDLTNEIGIEEENQYFSVRYGVEYWVKLGAPKNKLVVGIPLYGRVFTMDRPQDGHDFYSPAGQPGIAGPYTREGGFLGFHEICDLQKNQGSGFQRFWSKEIKAPYAVFQTNQWLGYDDIESIQIKVDFINELGLRGGMVWSVETDDFTGNCQLGPFADKKNPLLKTIAAGIFGAVPTADPSVTVPDPWTGKPTPEPDERCLQNGWNAPLCSEVYYWCQANGLAWEVTTQTCQPAGTVFDLTAVSCKDPAELGCSGGSTAKPPPTTSSSTTTTSTVKPPPSTLPIQTTQGGGQETTSTTTSTTTRPGVTNPGNICSYCKEVGNNPSPNSCKKFLRCWGSSGDWHCDEQQCAEGLGFDGTNCVWLQELPSCDE